MIISKNVNMIECSDWDKLVTSTYLRPYCFQQQEGCQPRGIVWLSIPSDDGEDEEHLPKSIPEVVNGNKMCVQFKSWLARDPKQPLPGKDDKDEFSLTLFWERNFYPSIHTVANDLLDKGLIEPGEYIINIDW
jgi:hypothetical protein